MILLFQTVGIAIWNLICGAAGSTGLNAPLTRQYSPVACVPLPEAGMTVAAVTVAPAVGKSQWTSPARSCRPAVRN